MKESLNTLRVALLPLVLALLCSGMVAPLSPTALGATSVTLVWDANSETNLAGYKLHYGPASGQYPNVITVGNVVTATVSNLTQGDYFLAVTAYNTEGLESDPSNEVSYSPPETPPTISNIADQTVSEDSSTSALSFQIADLETPASSLTLSANSSNPALIPVSGIVFGGSGSNRTVRVTPVANQSGAAVITITVTDAGGASASASFTLTVLGEPLITTHPQPQTVNPGSVVTFSVIASGPPPLSYQWQFNGLDIPGANNTSLILNDVQPEDSGSYSVVVSNAAGDVVSQPALLLVAVPAPSGLIGWWPGDGNALDYAGNHPGTLVNGTSFAPGKVQDAFNFDGADDYVTIGELPELQNATAITVMAWINKRDESNLYSGFVGRWDTFPPTRNNTFLLYNGEGTASHKGSLALNFSDDSGVVLKGNSRLPKNQWVHLAATWRSSDGFTALYKNGVLDSAATLGAGKNLKYLPGYTAKIGAWGVVMASSFKLNGQIDEAAIFNRSLSSAEVKSIYDSSSAGMDKSPRITSQPAGQAALVGASVVFTVNAIGQQPLAYQWRINGTNLVGATNATLVLDNLQLADVGDYTVLVSNPSGTTLSEPATLSVTDPALIGLLHWWTGDSNAFDYAGTNHGTLVNGATYGTGRVGPAFNLDGVNDYVELGETPELQGATEFTVIGWINKRDESNLYSAFVGRWDTFPPTRNNTFLLYNGEGTASHKGSLALNFSDDSGVVLKGNSRLPKNQWVHLAATWRSSDGFTALYKNGVLDSSGYAGAGKNLKYLPGYGAKIGEWGVVRTAANKFSGQIDEVIIFNRALSALEIQATVATGRPSFAGAPPAITLQPLDQSVSPDGNVTLAVVASGLPRPAYQWSFNGTPIPGATNSSLTITNFQSDWAARYQVAVSNAMGTAISAPADLFMDGPLRVLNTARQANGSFSLRVIGPANATYVVEASTNLTNWDPLATNTAPMGLWDFVDTTANNYSARYYRVLAVP